MAICLWARVGEQRPSRLFTVVAERRSLYERKRKLGLLLEFTLGFTRWFDRDELGGHLAHDVALRHDRMAQTFGAAIGDPAGLDLEHEALGLPIPAVAVVRAPIIRLREVAVGAQEVLPNVSRIFERIVRRSVGGAERGFAARLGDAIQFLHQR